MHAFTATLEIIGINPFVFVPEEILQQLFKTAGRSKSPIPVYGKINGVPYTQTLVRYSGNWRLYINTTMLPDSPARIGEPVALTIQVDKKDRTLVPHPKLIKALNASKKAKKIFDALPPSKQKEIVRYISYLKSEKSIAVNVERAIGFLLGKNRFIGRDKP